MKCAECPSRYLSEMAQELSEGCQGPVFYDASQGTDTLQAGPFCRAQTIVDKQGSFDSFVGIRIVDADADLEQQASPEEVDVRIGRAISAAIKEVRLRHIGLSVVSGSA